MPVGFRILPAQQTTDAKLIEALGKCATAHLADSMSHLQAASSALLPRHKAGNKLCGPALTVRVAPGDNLMIQKALDLARAGDVVVVDAGGYTEQAVVGEIMASYAITRQVAGFVVDGAIRDIDFISGIVMPIYARGVTPRGPSKVGPGEINTPVSIGGMVVQPGDIIVGDADGVVAIPASDLRTVLAAAQLLEAKELATLAAVKSGKVDRNWIDVALASSGFDHAREGSIEN